MESSIKKFTIKRLFGKKDVSLSFSNNVQIYIGENGLGKTTILNSLYYTLSGDFQKLSKINFEEIEIIFKKDKVHFSKNNLLKYLELQLKGKHRSSIEERIKEKLSISDAKELLQLCNQEVLLKERQTSISKYLKAKDIPISMGMSTRVFTEMIPSIVDEIVNGSDFFMIKECIAQNIKSKILYFPTYRRIEEDLQNLKGGAIINRKLHSYDDSQFINFVDLDLDEDEDKDIESSLIQFGMDDVEKRIKTITQKIIQSSVSGFSKLTGDMLSQLLRGYPDATEIDKINISDIKIILNRVGNNLTDEDKEQIINQISTKKIFEKGNRQLLYFLQQLLNLYRTQSLYDTAIKNFMEVCNGYLNDKHYEYNESSVDLRIFRDELSKTEKKEEVKLPQLSSGEKQIVSLFSKIYLEPEQNFIILFDEPELSLSIFWQKKLLPDILKSDRCDFLLAVTHSPFIFENELQQNTIGLKEFFSKAE